MLVGIRGEYLGRGNISVSSATTKTTRFKRNAKNRPN